MKKYDFDKKVSRLNTNSIKWDFRTNCSPKAQEDGLPLWIADMDFECADPIIDSLHKLVDHKIFGYSSNKTDEYYDAVCGWYKRRFNWDINREDIVFTPGVVPAVSLLIKILTEEGDGIIVQKPVYHPFEAKIKINKRRVVDNPLIYKNGEYTIDFEDLEEKAKSVENKLLILCSPHNPVGRVWKEEELKKIIEICKKHNLWVISDEIHSDLLRKGVKHTPMHSICGDYKDRVVVCTAPSKTFNLAGMQLSNIIISNKELRDKYKNEMMFTGVSMSPNPFAIVATIAAYNESEDWVDELNEYLDGNMEFIDTYLKENLPKVKLVKSQGTYLAWLDFTAYGLNEVELEDIMFKKANVLLDEGYIFGKEGVGFERVNAACPKSTLKDFLDRVKDAFKDM
ncbi:MalY/PatB family protein [Asaccharospora irregularis]|uniref:cysteine-S-conjugate beta-lyase n=1 Tax=Asaccharospora irregularis DSM 2635 TaxID=1121321 RepID=A0A1M5MPK3_9FIRM|nr:MalY/PatB family protein [Asaccharospora irregularis]SHG78693.1 cystathione beta-lyase [Asaccharospora irregularis DSM 2635]